MELQKRLVERAKGMRRLPAPTEALAWKLLRNKKLAGFRFRRQHVFEPYIVDFYCALATLVVEFDGDSHAENLEYDAMRTKYLESLGLKVIRFWNTELFEAEESVLESVYQECVLRTRHRQNLHTPSN